MKKVFIEGQEGTTGLQIYDRLKTRNDLELSLIPKDLRKDSATRKFFLNDADIVILCLPDEAAKESVSMIENPETKIIDASTAHRVDNDWIYGLPEMGLGQREKIRTSKRVANPGCYPTGVILMLSPLAEAGILPGDYPVSINAVSGFSGGGKKLIARYESMENDPEGVFSCRPYAIGKRHKHIDEMQKYSGLKYAPVFMPSVGNFYNGMLVTIPLFKRLLADGADARKVWEIIDARYASEKFIRVMEFDSYGMFEDGFLSPADCNGTNFVDIFIFEHVDQILLIARLDNLGKGASGAAVQNLNILMGTDEGKGLL